jgi:hypothetical protein
MWRQIAPALLLSVATVYGQGACSQVQLSPSTVTRNSSFRITINIANTALKTTTGTIAFVRSDRAPITAPISVDGNTVSYTIPPDFSLGKYNVELRLAPNTFPACESLSVVPAQGWQVKLDPFVPAGTSEVKDGRISVSLRGTGFDTGNPADNRIFINEVPVANLKWAKCDEEQPGTVFAELKSGDRIDLCNVPAESHGRLGFRIRQGDAQTELQTFRVYWISYGKTMVASAAAIIALILGLLVLALIKLLLRKQTASQRGVLDTLFLDSETDTYSLSKFQFYWWTVAAVFGYSYLVLGRMIVQGQNWPDIPSGLPAIIAVGAGTSVGAQFVSNVRGPKGAGAETPSLGDLVTSGGVAAPERVQFFIWTVLGVAAFVLSVLKYSPDAILALDPVPDGMLMMMGLSSAGYLGGKLARKPGPIVNEISVTPADSDDALTSEAVAQQAPPNLAQPAAQAQGVLQAFTTVPEGKAKIAVGALNDAFTAVSQVKTASDGQAAVAKLAQLQRTAESAASEAAADFGLPGSAPATRTAAEIAQRAAGALQDLTAATTAIMASSAGPNLPGSTGLRFTRVIELRGQNLSSEALFEINGDELPFRMLAEKDGKRLPEVVIREQDNPTLARVLRLSIDASQLESSDYKSYRGWFGSTDPSKPKTFSIVNPDGQKSDRTFTVPPSAAQSTVKTGQPPVAVAKEAGK